MPVTTDFVWVKYQDGTVVVQMTPAAPVGGQEFVFNVAKHFGSETPLITKRCASGYGDGVSGITVLNSGQGQLGVTLDSVDTSGWDPGAYACWCDRLDSGARTAVARGYMGVDL